MHCVLRVSTLLIVVQAEQELSGVVSAALGNVCPFVRMQSLEHVPELCKCGDVGGSDWKRASQQLAMIRTLEVEVADDIDWEVVHTELEEEAWQIIDIDFLLRDRLGRHYVGGALVQWDVLAS